MAGNDRTDVTAGTSGEDRNEVLDAAEQERFRIGSELHEGVAQQLAGLAMKAHVTAARLREQGDAEAETLSEFSAELNSAVSGLRTAVHDLTPMALEGAELGTALQALTRATSEHYGVHCTFEAREPAPQPEHRVAVQLLRLASEAVHNAVTHGSPSRVAIEIADEGDCLTLSVDDDGTGMPPRPRHAGIGHHEGTGLRFMRYRAGVIGAGLEIDSKPGGGSVIRCTVPQ